MKRIAMKTNIATASVLEEARAAKTSAEMETALNKIEAAKGELVTQSEALRALLEDAIISGRDLTKHQEGIARCDKEAMTYEAALSAFSRRKDEMAKAEEAPETDGMKREAEKLAEEYADACRDTVTKGADFRAAYARQDAIREQLTRLNMRLEAKGVSNREIVKPVTIARQTVGEVPKVTGATEFARRVDEALYAVLNDLANGTNTSPRRRDNIRWGREGESRAARSQFAALAQMQRPAE
jgi:hypothetical protein